MHQLEILLLLKRYPERVWTAQEVARELYTSALSAENEMRDMAESGFMSMQTDDQGQSRYQYRPSSTTLDRQVSELMEAYKLYRVRVIDEIFSRPRDNLKHFADAFKLRHDEEEEE